MTKRILSALITTVLLFFVLFLLAMIGVWFVWYTIKIALLAALGFSLFCLIVFLLTDAKKKDSADNP